MLTTSSFTTAGLACYRVVVRSIVGGKSPVGPVSSLLVMGARYCTCSPCSLAALNMLFISRITAADSAGCRVGSWDAVGACGPVDEVIGLAVVGGVLRAHTLCISAACGPHTV